MQWKLAAAAGMMSIGYVAIGIGVVGDGLDAGDLRSCGIGTVIGALVWFLNTRSRKSETAIFKAGQKIGYDDGWRDCRSTQRPVVVALDEHRERVARDAAS